MGTYFEIPKPKIGIYFKLSRPPAPKTMGFKRRIFSIMSNGYEGRMSVVVLRRVVISFYPPIVFDKYRYPGVWGFPKFILRVFMIRICKKRYA